MDTQNDIEPSLELDQAPNTNTSTATIPPKSRRTIGKKPLTIIAALLILIVGAGVYFGFVNKSTDKVYHVGILNALDFFSATTDGFKQKMTELGYIEGKNIVYDIQKAQTPGGNEAIIKGFVDAKVDLILAFPTEASLEAKAGTAGTGIPVVSANVFTEGTDLVDSLQHPGNNFTGVRFPGPEVALRRFELLIQLAPKTKRYLVPYLKDYPTVSPQMAVLEPAAKAAGITLVSLPFDSPPDYISYLETRPASGDQGYDAILLIAEPLSAIPDTLNATYAYGDKQKLPTAGAIILETDTGPIFSIFPNSFEVGELAAPLADKIFKGTPAGDIPIVTPESEFSVNYKVILKLGLEIEDGLLSTAVNITR